MNANALAAYDQLWFQNLSENRMSPDDVLSRLLRFVAQDPRCEYHFVIGTDSQVHRGHTKFVTGIVLHRLGKGAWACYRQFAVPRELKSIREKLSLETACSQQVAAWFDQSVIGMIEELLLPHVYHGASLETYIDIDAGTEPIVNKTAMYVQEMMERVEATGLYAPRVKPEAFVASSYANRYTKRRMAAR